MIDVAILNLHSNFKELKLTIDGLLNTNKQSLSNIETYTIIDCRRLDKNLLESDLKSNYPDLSFQINPPGISTKSVSKAFDDFFNIATNEYVLWLHSGMNFHKSGMVEQSLEVLNLQPNILQVCANVCYPERINPIEGKQFEIGLDNLIRRFVPISYKIEKRGDTIIIENQIGVSLEPGLMRKSDWGKYTRGWSKEKTLYNVDAFYKSIGMFVVTICNTTKEEDQFFTKNKI